MPYFLGLFAVPDGVCKMNRVLIFVVLQVFLTPLAAAESLKILLTNDDGYLSSVAGLCWRQGARSKQSRLAHPGQRR